MQLLHGNGRIVSAFTVVCGLVAALDLGYHLGRQGLLRSAEGQAAGGEVILTGANTQNDAFCFIYNTKTSQLASYMQRASGGIELKAIRTCSSDFIDIAEYPKGQGPTAVANWKKTAAQVAKAREKEKESGGEDGKK